MRQFTFSAWRSRNFLADAQTLYSLLGKHHSSVLRSDTPLGPQSARTSDIEKLTEDATLNWGLSESVRNDFVELDQPAIASRGFDNTNSRDRQRPRRLESNLRMERDLSTKMGTFRAWNSDRLPAHPERFTRASKLPSSRMIERRFDQSWEVAQSARDSFDEYENDVVTSSRPISGQHSTDRPPPRNRKSSQSTHASFRESDATAQEHDRLPKMLNRFKQDNDRRSPFKSYSSSMPKGRREFTTSASRFRGRLVLKKERPQADWYILFFLKNL